MHKILVKMGYALHGHFILVTSNNVCRVGHTAPETKEIVKKSMCARAMQARRMCLLLIDTKHGMEGKSDWKERNLALMELLVTLFHTALLREK